MIMLSFVWIRRLRRSPRYLLAVLQWKMTVSANLRHSPQNFRKSCAEKWGSPGSQNPYCLSS